ncbi:MAG: UvrD-helicase domain-containing protein, partial [Chitinophagales bacterium]|nr:UvrD-helicase domain-containing protein [Chitinophagales bacterium]
MDYLKELNKDQHEAVTNYEGPSLIIAGPGSGKTRVLTYRTIYLLEKGIDPFNVLLLTFTNKAAGEMRSRVESIMGNEARNIYMGTFHSVFARILRTEAQKIGYSSNFVIYDTTDSRNLIKAIVKELGLNDKLYKPSFVHNRISIAKNSLILPAKYKEDVEITSEDASNGRPRLGDVYEKYVKRCFRSGAMDFDDLLLKMYFMLADHPELLYKYQHRFQYVMIDEFQDTNYVQYEIVRKLADVFQNISVVGDDAQSIYAFRGATIHNILNFRKNFPDLKVYKLEQNYRSTKNIVSAANAIIENNKNQLKKEIWTDNGEGSKVKVIKAVSDNEEGRIIADSIFETKVRDHFKNEDFAILYRTNAQSRAFEEALRRLNIPYLVYGGLSFYQRKEVKDLIAYLRLTINPMDEEALRRIINYPTRGIGKTTIERLTVLASDNDVSIWTVLENIESIPISGRAKSALANFVQMIKSFQVMANEQNAYDIAHHIAKSSGILKELYTDKSIEGLSRFENLQELLNGINEFVEEDTVENIEESTSGDKSLATYLQNIALLTSDDLVKDKTDSVKLMTIHSAKGLEFENVFIVGLEENLFPSAMSLNTREDLEEERRLFYVAVTRAMKNLSLSFATTRFKFGNLQYCEPSRFLEELPEEILESNSAFKKPKPDQTRTTHVIN